jgi:hypothetical protein
VPFSALQSSLVIDYGFFSGIRGPLPSSNLGKSNQNDPFTPAAFQLDALRDELCQQVAAFATTLFGRSKIVEVTGHAKAPAIRIRCQYRGAEIHFFVIMEMRFVLNLL